MKRLLLAIFALALLATACGSDDDDTGTAETTTAAPTTAAPDDGGDDTTTAAPATTEAMEDEPVEFTDVTLLVVNNMAHLPTFLASDFGLWTDRGLNVDVQILGGGADIAAGLTAGQAEFGAVNATPGFRHNEPAACSPS